MREEKVKEEALRLYKEYYQNRIAGDERFIWIAKFFFKDIQKKTILDVGCGEGTLLEILRKQNNEVFGVDASQNGINKCQPKKLTCYLLDLNHHYLPFKDDYFDVVTCLETMEHLENPYHCLREIKRVLKKEGLFLISIPNPKMIHPKCYPALFSLEGFMEFLKINDFYIRRIKGWGQALMLNKLLYRHKDKKAWFNKFIYGFFYQLTRRRNKLFRALGTPLTYAHCFNFECINHKLAQGLLQQGAEKT